MYIYVFDTRGNEQKRGRTIMNIDKKTIVAIVLCIVAVLVVVWRVKSGLTPSRPAAKPGAAKSKPAAPATGKSEARASRAAAKSKEISLKAKGYSNLIAALKESDIDYEAKSFRNPMTPLVKEYDKRSGGKAPWKPQKGIAATTLAGYTIEGIVWDDVAPLALVNSQVVGVGDRLDDGTKIIEITKKKVRFTRNGREYFLEFREE